SDVEHMANLISGKLNFQEQADVQENNWQDRGWLLILPLVIFMLAWFRKGFVVYGFLMLFTLNSCSDESNFQDLWYTKDYQGQQLENEGRYQEAGDMYEDPMRSGVAYYKAGDYESAVEEFSKDTTAEGAYNLGLAYYKNGDYAAAQMAFGEAYEMNPEMKDAANNQVMLGHLIDGQEELNPEEALEEGPQQRAQNTENKDDEDLGGGGQEATEEDMQIERKEETVTTEVRTAKELEEVPEDFQAGEPDPSQKVLMRKVDDDPALFLKRKFQREVKVKNLKPKKDNKKW
ncbi:MAG: magnesium chelatase, partial [Schleiferiaceae bacterium]|nr:magnesium chelatase [Schleiferiaceae bacterium]